MMPAFINHTLLDSLQTPYFVVDAKLDICYCNQVMLDIQGNKAHAFSILSEGVSLPSPINEPVVKALITQQVVEQVIVLSNHDATMSAFSIKATPFTEGEATYVAISALDITLNHRKANTESVFFHDLINLSGSMAGYLEVIQDFPSEEIAQHVPSIKKIADQLVDDIVCERKIVRAEENRLEGEINPIDLIPFLHELQAYIDEQAFARGRVCAIQAPATDTTLYTDERILKRILFILLQQAAENTARGETYTLNVHTTSQTTLFTVHHNVKIDPRDAHHLFEFGYASKGNTNGTAGYYALLLAQKGLNGTIEIQTSQTGTQMRLDIPSVHPLANTEDIEKN